MPLNEINIKPALVRVYHLRRADWS